MVELKAAAACVHAHAVVRQLAYVVAACAGGVNFPARLVAVLSHNSLEYPLGRRRPANIAQAHKKYSYFLFALQRVNKFYCFMVYIVVYHICFIVVRSMY